MAAGCNFGQRGRQPRVSLPATSLPGLTLLGHLSLCVSHLAGWERSRGKGPVPLGRWRGCATGSSWKPSS